LISEVGVDVDVGDVGGEEEAEVDSEDGEGASSDADEDGDDSSEDSEEEEEDEESDEESDALMLQARKRLKSGEALSNSEVILISEDQP